MKKILLFISLTILLISSACSSEETPLTPENPETPTETPPLTVTATKVDVTIYGSSDGAVTITPTGGTPPYTITPSQTALGAGDHTFTITDSKGQTITITTQIAQPKATIPQSALLRPAIKNINKNSTTGKTTATAKRVIKSIQFDKDKYKIDEASDYSLTDNLYSTVEDQLNTNTPKGDIRTYTYNDAGQLIQIYIQKGPNSLGSSGIEFSYEYDSDGNVVNKNTPYTYENGLITSVLMDGYLTLYTYDAQGRVISRKGNLNASSFEYTDQVVKETRFDVIPATGEVPTGRIIVTKYDSTKAGIYNNEPYYKIATTFSSILGQTLPNPYLHIINQTMIDNDVVQKSQSYKYFYDTDGYLIKVDDGMYVTIYTYE
ncbi:SprB repeat-containing protein [Flavobacterium sp. ACN6]|uniref:SprB repeat-containing protein n=1 Tax=Flavobacterium sp. ACN6 TaxID=1920426 RepID=UPI000BB35F45|nr:SprB repeat-containing protein [Flavobacterium sp. ACN6]PBJ11373.1 hypothetical protein BSF42_27770 [Flavobacterium sp. ACN6]